jgi:CRP-like cAMP-binding protein
MKNSQLLMETIESQNLWEKEYTVNRNDYIKVAGSVDTNIYFIVNGSARIFVIDEFEEHTIRFGYKNNVLVAMDSYITGTPSEYYIQALKRTGLKVISKQSVVELIEKQPELQQSWNALLELIVFQQLERERDILTTSPLARYKRVLKRSPQLFQEIPNKYIASYLRMTPETLSRLKKH